MRNKVRTPDLAVQRAAMEKLSFLRGEWSGEARILRGADALELFQTERAEFKLDGLLLLIEGVGRSKNDGKAGLQALGMVSYDDESGSYWMRAFNDGRYLETQMRLDPQAGTLSWGFALGEVRTHSVLRLNDRGEWTEIHEITVGNQPSRKFMEVAVTRVK
jgi:hypothetical protein